MSKPSKLRLALETLEDRCLLATRVWDGGAVSNNWSNANNWVGNVAPVAGDDLVFAASAADKTADNNFADGTHFRSITVQGGYTLRGNRVLLGEGGIVSSGSSNVINNDLSLGSGVDRTFLINTGSTLFVDGRIEGANGLLKSGGGDLSFRANNTYSGLTDIAAGRLFIEKDESLGGSASGTNIRNGATLLINDTAIGTIRIQEPITVQSGGTIRAVNDVELRGTITTVGVANFKHDGGALEELLVNAVITGPGGLNIQSGSGRVWLQGPSGNSYQGTTTVSGELHLDNAHGAVPGNLVVQSGGNVVREDNTLAGPNLLNFDAIGDTAVVTINSGGTFTFAKNHARERIHTLVLNGGRVQGTDIDDGRGFVLTQFTATSVGSQSAVVEDISLLIEGEEALLKVLNGPAFNDLVANGTEQFIFDLNRNLAIRAVTVLEGGGTFLENIESGSLSGGAEVREGLYRMSGTPGFQYDVLVKSGAAFAGEGAIDQLTVEAGGRVRPGPLSSPGKLKVEELQMAPGAILEVFLNGSVAGTGHDQLEVSGNINIDGAILEPTLGTSAAVGQNYRILNNNGAGPIPGEFVAPATVPPTGQQLLVNYFGGTLNNDVVLSLINTAPMAPGLAIDQTDISTGDLVTVTGHLVDPDGAKGLRLLVDWGDGSKKQVLMPGLDDFTLRHRYRRAGEFVARFKWIDQTGQGNGREFTINVAPGIPLGGNQLRTLTDRVFALGLKRSF